MSEKTDNFVEQEIIKRAGAAEKLLSDSDKTERFLERLEQKLNKVPVVGSALAAIPVFISLVRSFVKKEYRDIPLGSVIAVVVGLIYFLAPADLVPDAVPLAGHIDDAVMILGIGKLVKSDVNDYKKWQKKNGKRIIDADR